MAKIGSYRWEGREKILRSLEKADKQEIADALEEVASGNCDEGPIEGSGPTPDETVTIHPLTFDSYSFIFIP